MLLLADGAVAYIFSHSLCVCLPLPLPTQGSNQPGSLDSLCCEGLTQDILLFIPLVHWPRVCNSTQTALLNTHRSECNPIYLAFTFLCPDGRIGCLSFDWELCCKSSSLLSRKSKPFEESFQGTESNDDWDKWDILIIEVITPKEVVMLLCKECTHHGLFTLCI